MLINSLALAVKQSGLSIVIGCGYFKLILTHARTQIHSGLQGGSPTLLCLAGPLTTTNKALATTNQTLATTPGALAANFSSSC